MFVRYVFGCRQAVLDRKNGVYLYDILNTRDHLISIMARHGTTVAVVSDHVYTQLFCDKTALSMWIYITYTHHNAQKMKFSIKDFFSKCDQIRRKLKKSLMKNFIFCEVHIYLHFNIF